MILPLRLQRMDYDSRGTSSQAVKKVKESRLWACLPVLTIGVSGASSRLSISVSLSLCLSVCLSVSLNLSLFACVSDAGITALSRRAQKRCHLLEGTLLVTRRWSSVEVACAERSK